MTLCSSVTFILFFPSPHCVLVAAAISLYIFLVYVLASHSILFVAVDD